MEDKILRQNLLGLLDEILEVGVCPHTSSKLKDIREMVNDSHEWEIIKTKNIIEK